MRFARFTQVQDHTVNTFMCFYTQLVLEFRPPLTGDLELHMRIIFDPRTLLMGNKD